MVECEEKKSGKYVHTPVYDEVEALPVSANISLRACAGTKPVQGIKASACDTRISLRTKELWIYSNVSFL